MSQSVRFGCLLFRCSKTSRVNVQQSFFRHSKQQHLLRPVVAFYSSNSKKTEYNYGLQGHQEHEFSPSRSREILTAQATVESGKVDVERELQKGPHHNEISEAGEPSDRPYDAHGSVSLYSVMQTNVPEPYQPNVRGNPTHMNMPGGGFSRDEKYVSDRFIHASHPKRQYATNAAQDTRVEGTQDMYEDVFTPTRPATQGIQGDDCISFRLWLQNCAFYGLDCEKQAGDFQAGRRTLAQIFDEQEKQIDEVSRSYRANAVASDAGLQGVQGSGTETMDILSRFEAPCLQGVQGENCNQFKLWLQNCSKFGAGIECERAFRQYVSGRKTLHQLFVEQEEMINKIQKRSYSSSADKSDGMNVSQKDRLKKAVKEYGGTVVVFHVCISLVSLGGFYMAVSSGLDVIGLLSKIGVGETILNSKITTGASTFVVAYAVHKVFAPARIACTLTCTPFLVRYLRRIGFLKKPSATK